MHFRIFDTKDSNRSVMNPFKYNRPGTFIDLAKFWRKNIRNDYPFGRTSWSNLSPGPHKLFSAGKLGLTNLYVTYPQTQDVN